MYGHVSSPVGCLKSCLETPYFVYPEMSPPRSLRMHARACLTTSRKLKHCLETPYFVYPDLGTQKRRLPRGGARGGELCDPRTSWPRRVSPLGPVVVAGVTCHAARRTSRHVARPCLDLRGCEVGRRVAHSGRAHCARTGVRAYQHASVCTRSRAGGRSPLGIWEWLDCNPVPPRFTPRKHGPLGRLAESVARSGELILDPGPPNAYHMCLVGY